MDIKTTAFGAVAERRRTSKVPSLAKEGTRGLRSLYNISTTAPFSRSTFLRRYAAWSLDISDAVRNSVRLYVSNFALLRSNVEAYQT